jgi:sodium-dependent phosphate transporter
VMMTILKGAKAKAEELGTDDQVNEAKDGNMGPVAVTGFIAGAIVAFLVACSLPWLSKYAEEKAAKAELEEAAEKSADVEGKGVELSNEAGSEKEGDASALGYVQGQLNSDPHAILKEDAKINAIHENYVRHDRRSEEMFKFVQVFTAMVAAFSHGANDVANAMGPFAAIYMTWKHGSVSTSKEEVGDDMYWILAIGGAGISIGLATYGYKIMSVIGVKMTAITPSRGYCIELAAAFVVIYGTTQGWPLSTTHCQVGATVGIGLFEGKGGVHFGILAKIIFGWGITLIVVGLSAAILVGPSPEPVKDLYC